MLILAVLCADPLRFNAIKRRLEGITQKALTQALRRVERNGLVARRIVPVSPVAVEYSVTPLGRTLEQPFVALYGLDGRAPVRHRAGAARVRRAR